MTYIFHFFVIKIYQLSPTWKYDKKIKVIMSFRINFDCHVILIRFFFFIYSI